VSTTLIRFGLVWFDTHRLVARHTIEEIILRRSMHKLQRTQEIVDSGTFASTSAASSAASAEDDLVCFSISHLVKKFIFSLIFMS
jgi:hypothetical protein